MVIMYACPSLNEWAPEPCYWSADSQTSQLERGGRDVLERLCAAATRELRLTYTATSSSQKTEDKSELPEGLYTQERGVTSP